MKSTGATGIQRRILTAGGALTVRLHRLGPSERDHGSLQTQGNHHNQRDELTLHGLNSSTVAGMSMGVPVMDVWIVRVRVL
jgi:hypothetical protein